MQSSFQAGAIEWSLPALTVTNPVVSVIVGTTAFPEGVTAPGLVIAALAASLAVMVTGVIVLARSPALDDRLRHGNWFIPASSTT
jgi:hypothetical protein